jgi:hypothetical protein
VLILACGDVPVAAPPPTPTVVDDGRPRLLPVDRAAEDPSFVAYRERLLSAIDANDLAALQSLVDPNIRTGFGGGGGWADFREQWDLRRNELATILRMGGSFAGPPESRRFCAPYVYSDWPETFDAFEYLAVTDDDVALRASPSDDAAVVAEMDYEIVRSLDHDFDKPWRRVELSDKKSGWVRGDKVRSSIGYRACFQKPAGEWKMNLLVAGD